MAEDDQAALEMPDSSIGDPATLPVQPIQDTSSEHPTSALDDPFERAARRTVRGQIHHEATPIVSSSEEYAALEPGSKYIHRASGERLEKAYVVNKGREQEDYDQVPEGAKYETPDGQVLTKAKSDPVDYTAQTLYSMATNSRERKKALERSYPGMVREDSKGELYVDDNGKIRRPKGFFDAPLAGVSAMAAPAIGSTVGEIGGGLLGSAAPGVGTVAGAITGGAAGGAAGQTFNDAILALTGVYDRSAGEQLAETGLASILGGVGTAAGRAISAIPKAGFEAGKSAAPKAVRGILGVEDEGLQSAINMREKGADLVPPSSWAKGAPYVANIAEVFDPAFRMQQPIKEAGIKYYDKITRGIASKLGIELDEELVSKPAAAVSSREAGELLLKQRTARLQEADAKLQAKLEAHSGGVLLPEQQQQVTVRLRQLEQEAEQLNKQKNALDPRSNEGTRIFDAIDANRAEQVALNKKIEAHARGTASKTAPLIEINSAAAEARMAAQQVINSGFQEIQGSVRTAMHVAEAGHNSGDLWQAVANQMRSVHAGITERGRVMYSNADRLAGNVLPHSEGIPDLATDFLRELPPQFRAHNPQVVQELERLAGIPKMDPHGQPIPGEWAVEPHEPTFGELRRIRSLLRGEANWTTLSGDTRNGTFKFFAHRVDEALRDVAAVPELQAAVTQLNAADEFWRDNIRIFDAQQVRAVMRGIEAGEPADAKQLFNVIMKEGHTDLTNRLMDMIGPALAGGVRAADVQEMLNASRTLVPGQLDGMKFVREVLDRTRRGMLESIHGPRVAGQLTEQAQRIAMLEGKLNIPTRHGDTALDIISRAHATAQISKEAARRDPLTTFAREMQTIKNDHAKELATARRNDPLNVIFKPTVGASEAADHILANEDLLLAAADRFKRTSPEFEALRQVYVKRLFSGSTNLAAGIEKISPEIQALMFPGTTLQDLKTLAKEMEHYTRSKAGGTADTAKSMAAQAKVNHPWSSIPGGKMVGKFIPGVDAGGRAMLGKYYKTVTEVSNNLTLMKWLAKGLRGDEQAKLIARETLQRIMQKGGAAGASVGGILHSFPHQPGMPGEIEEGTPQKFEAGGGSFSDEQMPEMLTDPNRFVKNSDSFDRMTKSWPKSKNIEDRRGQISPQDVIDDDFSDLNPKLGGSAELDDTLRIAVRPNDRSKRKKKR